MKHRLLIWWHRRINGCYVGRWSILPGGYFYYTCSCKESWFA